MSALLDLLWEAFLDLWPALVLATLTLAWGLLAHALGRFFREDSDVGYLWARALVVSGVVALLGFLLGGLAEAILPLYPDWWTSGRHLWLDRMPSATWPHVLSFWGLAVAAWAPWGAVVAVFAIFGAERPAGAWLAGRLRERGSRRWVLLLGLPLAGFLAVAAFRLMQPGLPEAVPVVPFTAALTGLVSLFFAAFSEGSPPPRPAARARRALPEAPALPAWPEAMGELGLPVAAVVRWTPTATERTERPGPLTETLAALGAREVAPEIAESVGLLLADPATGRRGPGAGGSRAALLLAPDDAGQLEALAAAARILGERQHELSLVVSSGPPGELVAGLRDLLGEDFVHAPAPGAPLEPGRAAVVVVSAQQLGEHVLPRLVESGLCQRLGLVAWWDVHTYTGVLAANVWAISRRLQRLVSVHGRRGVRALAFARREEHGGAQQRRFVTFLLPYHFPTSLVVEVPLRFARSVHLHQLGSHEAFVRDPRHERVATKDRYAPAVAAYASALTGWPTHLDEHAGLPADVLQDVRRLSVAGETLGDVLVPRPADAGARIVDLPDAEALSLVDRVAQGGRRSPPGRPHHVALAAPENPYVAWLLQGLLRSGEAVPVLEASRLLVNSQSNQGIVRRHLQQALGELPDTRMGLAEAMQWDWALVADTLQRIQDRHELDQVEVRWLDHKGRLQLDRQYSMRERPAPLELPLDTVGTELIDVVEVAAGRDAGVRLRLDRERLPIAGYRGRIFMAGGHRYRIRDWAYGPRATPPERLECEAWGEVGRTWRKGASFVDELEALGPAKRVGHEGHGQTFVRWRAAMTYTEHVKGSVTLARDLTTGRMLPSQEADFPPLQTSFPTSGVVLHFPHRPHRVHLDSVAAALRLALPVHFGVAADALAVVPVTTELLDDTDLHGLAIVDLYPDGMGLVDAFGQDDGALLGVLGRCRDWLSACPCQSPQGCAECLQGPLALALSPDRTHTRAGALALLDRVLPHRAAEEPP